MRKHPIMAFGIIAILVALGIYFFGFRQPKNYETNILMLKGQEFRVDIADTMAKQSKGLSGRESLGEHEGMLFDFGSYGTRTFWMPDMNFPIDIIWIKDMTVVGAAENAEPEPGVSMFRLKRYSSPEPVDKVLEVPAGTMAKLGVRAGDSIVIK